MIESVSRSSHSLMKCIITLLTALLLVSVHAAEIEITDRTVIFKHTSTDPKDPANQSGYNLGPSLALLPDGRLMAAWFSSPSEGAESQRIVQAFSLDQGRTWGEATVLQDIAGRADFDPALFVAGKETFLFFSCFDPQIDIYFRRSSNSAQTWTAPVKLHHTLQWHCVVHRRAARAAAHTRHQGRWRDEITRWWPNMDTLWSSGQSRRPRW
jgi:predicted neuraminidase